MSTLRIRLCNLLVFLMAPFIPLVSLTAVRGQSERVASHPVPSGSHLQKARDASGQQGHQEKIHVNHATFDELCSLPGIGPVLARRILDYRKSNPPFRRIEELLIVRGISRNKLEKLRPKITLE